MFAEQHAYEAIGLAAAGYGLYQANNLHTVEHEKARQRHKEAIELAKKQHQSDMKTVKQTYLLQLFNSLEQHFQQLNADLIASSRESERDMFDQRNQSFQTIILASSVMFAALSSIIVDGTLPESTDSWLLVAYALTSALSFAFLFLSIVFCIELVIRTSQFMYKRGQRHTEGLRRAINDTKQMMRDLRGEGNYRKLQRTTGNPNSGGFGNSGNSSDVGNIASSSSKVRPVEGGGLGTGVKGFVRRSFENIVGNRSSSSVSGLDISGAAGNHSASSNIASDAKAIRRAISRMNPSEIEEEFERHETEIRNYLRKREELNDSAAITSHREDVSGVKRPFKYFWEKSCQSWWDLAVLLFYGGSLNMLLALMVYMWAQFLIFYNSLVGAIIGVSLIGSVVIIGVATVIVMREVDRREDAKDDRALHAIGASASTVGANLYDSMKFPTNLGTSAGGGLPVGGGGGGFPANRSSFDQGLNNINSTGGGSNVENYNYQYSHYSSNSNNNNNNNSAWLAPPLGASSRGNRTNNNSQIRSGGGSGSGGGAGDGRRGINSLAVTALTEPSRRFEAGALGTGIAGDNASESLPDTASPTSTPDDHSRSSTQQQQRLRQQQQHLHHHRLISNGTAAGAALFTSSHDIEGGTNGATAGAAAVNDWVNSDITLPPSMTPEHVYHAEPSPRRRFLGAYGPSTLLRKAIERKPAKRQQQQQQQQQGQDQQLPYQYQSYDRQLQQRQHQQSQSPPSQFFFQNQHRDEDASQGSQSQDGAIMF